MANVQFANEQMVDSAVRYVRAVAEALMGSGVEPRFSISFEGFGVGGTSNVDALFAQRYLTSLASSSDPHFRYATRIRTIDVSVQGFNKLFSA